MNEELAREIMGKLLASQMHGEHQPIIKFMRLRQDASGVVYAHVKVTERIEKSPPSGRAAPVVVPEVLHYKVYEGHEPQKVLLSEIQADKEV